MALTGMADDRRADAAEHVEAAIPLGPRRGAQSALCEVPRAHPHTVYVPCQTVPEAFP